MRSLLTWSDLVKLQLVNVTRNGASRSEKLSQGAVVQRAVAAWVYQYHTADRGVLARERDRRRARAGKCDAYHRVSLYKRRRKRTPSRLRNLARTTRATCAREPVSSQQ